MSTENTDWRASYDWKEAFTYGGNVRWNPISEGLSRDAIGIDDVTEVIAMAEGENDGASWLMAGRVKDGRYFLLCAGCDYTGWDCQASGEVMFAGTRDDLIRFCLSDDDRSRLGLALNS